MKKYLHILIFAVIFLLSMSFYASALQAIYVNDAETRFEGEITDAYAIGSDGVVKISVGHAYALTASGLQLLNTDDGTGGGGLLYDDGTVQVAADRVKVGLRYYYSDARDKVMSAAYLSVETAVLENDVGRGFAFGSIDAERRFVQADEEAVTAETSIYARRLAEEGTGIGIYSSATDELLYSVDYSNSGSYLAVHPLSEDGAEPLTVFEPRRYYGDFCFADLGNGKLTVVNVVDVEHYIMGVVAQEVGSSFPVEAIKAQAVAARTYAMYCVAHSAYNVRCGFDVTGDTYSQAYIGYTDSQKIISAMRETENQYLTYNGQLIEAVYFAADGGSTLNSEDVWSSAIPYLRGVNDPYESAVWTRGALGHRVGMSQRGAQAMAQYFNKDYKDILGFYYTKVGLSYGYR